MAFEKEMPRWEREGTEPPESKKITGWDAGDKPPADYFNWQWKGAYEAVKELQEKAVDKTNFEVPDNSITDDKLSNNPGQIKERLSTHLAETAIYAAGGTANAITISTPKGNYTYSHFRRLSFKASSSNAGNVTINVDNRGAVPALKFDGTQLPAGAIKPEKVYDWYFDSSNGGRFFLIAKASGNATTGDVLAGKTASNDDGEFTGTMPNRGAVNQTITTQGGQYAIPQGYHNGLGTVTANFANLIAGNVRQGINIGGIVGNLHPGYYADGTIQVPTNSSQMYIRTNGFGLSRYTLSVDGLGFRPKVILAKSTSPHHALIAFDDALIYGSTGRIVNFSVNDAEGSSLTGGYAFRLVAPASITDNGFNLPVANAGMALNYFWQAWG